VGTRSPIVAGWTSKRIARRAMLDLLHWRNLALAFYA
jgi:hypothetical protein